MTDNKKSGRLKFSDLEKDFASNTQSNENNFPLEVFPDVLQKILIEVSHKHQFPIDYLGAGTISSASTAIGCKYKIKIKEGWQEKCNLFIVIVGRPGDSKSHSQKFCFSPIIKRDAELYQSYLQELHAYENSKEANENKDNLKKPTLKRSLINDYTPEALMLILRDNPNGICIYSDELLGWFKNFNRYNNSGEAETYLSLWSGNYISSDRASGKSIRIDDPFVSLIGNTQIGVLKELTKNNRDINGFLDRLLFVFPDNPSSFKWNKDHVDREILESYHNIIIGLLDLRLPKTKLILDKEAESRVFDWQNNRPEDFFYDYERSAEIKLQQMVFRFALIIHLLRFTCNETKSLFIDKISVDSGIKLMEYFKENALKVRIQTTLNHYIDSLNENQKAIYSDLPNEKFKTKEGIEIACRLNSEGKPRVSERTFKSFLRDERLFKRLEHGHYLKTYTY